MGSIKVTYREGVSGPTRYDGVRKADFERVEGASRAYRLTRALRQLLEGDEARREALEIFRSAGINVSSLDTPPARREVQVTLYRIRPGNTGITVRQTVHLPAYDYIRVEFVDAVDVEVREP